MNEKDIAKINSYFQMYRRLDSLHASEEDFKKFKEWAESEIGSPVNQIFNVFETFYSLLDQELVSQGIKEEVLKDDFDPKSLSNPAPIMGIIETHMLSNITMGSFLGALGSSWGKQKLAFNNLMLNYELLALTEKYKDNPEFGSQISETIQQFLLKYNEDMGTLTSLINGRADKVDEKQIQISDKLVEVVTKLGNIFDNTKDVPALVSSVAQISEMLKEVKTDPAKVNEALEKLNTALEKLGAIQEILKTINEKVGSLGTDFERALEVFKGVLVQELKKIFNDELKGPLLDEIKAILVEEVKKLLNEELKGPMLDELKRFMLNDFRDELLESFNELLDRREEERRMARGSFKSWINKHWPKVVVGTVGLGLFLTAGHGMTTSIMRGDELDENHEIAVGVYEMYYGEGSAANMSYEDIMSALGAINQEKHSQEEVDKIAAHDKAVADYESLMGKLAAEYEKVNGEGSSKDKTIEELLEGIMVSGGNIQSYESEIAMLYDTLIGGNADNLADMIAELKAIEVKTAGDAATIENYESLVAGIAETYTEVTGLDATGVTPEAMLDAIVGAIASTDEVSGRSILLALYSNITNKDGSSMSNDELVAWATSCGLIGDVTLEPENNPDVYMPENG